MSDANMKLLMVVALMVVCLLVGANSQGPPVKKDQATALQAIGNYSIDPISTFRQLVSASGLESQLNDTSRQLTVLAPSNEAFRRFTQSLNITQNQLVSNETLLRGIISHHVIPNLTLSTDNLKALMNGDPRYFLQGKVPTLMHNDSIQLMVSNVTVFNQYQMGDEDTPAGNLTTDTIIGYFGEPSPNNQSLANATGYTEVLFDMDGDAGDDNEVDYGEDSASIVVPDIMAGSGVVHIIDRVLVPSSLVNEVVNLSPGTRQQTSSRVEPASGPVGGGRKALLFRNML